MATCTSEFQVHSRAYPDVYNVWNGMSRSEQQAVLSIVEGTCDNVPACVDAMGDSFASLFNIENVGQSCLVCLAEKLNAMPFEEWTQSSMYGKLLPCATLSSQSVFMERLGRLSLLIQEIQSSSENDWAPKTLQAQMNGAESNSLDSLNAWILVIGLIIIVVLAFVLAFTGKKWMLIIIVALVILVFLSAFSVF